MLPVLISIYPLTNINPNISPEDSQTHALFQCLLRTPYVPAMPSVPMEQKAGATVINIGGAKLVAGDDHSHIVQDPTQGGDKKVNFSLSKENDKPETKNENVGGIPDFTQNLVIKKLE